MKALSSIILILFFSQRVFCAFELEFTEEDLGYFHYLSPLSEIDKKVTSSKGLKKQALNLSKAFHLWQKKNNRQAISILKELVYTKDFPLIDYARFTLGSVYLEEQHLNAALFHFNKIDQSSWAVKEGLWLSLANIYFWKNDFNSAHFYFEKYINLIQNKQNPLSQVERREKYFYPRFRWALVLEKNNPTMALEQFKEILTSFPDENPLFFKNKIRKLSKKLKIKFEIPAEFYFKMAKSQAHIRNYEKAQYHFLLYLKKSSEKDPYVYDTLVELQRIYKLEKNTRKQKRIATLLSKYKHEEKPIYQHELELAKIYWNEENLKKALSLAQKVAHEAPSPF
ncbi:MAG: hypothetical protein HYS98_01335, partial [Deltaproteobacteria bacterium]|nr:hypothetical protein [Deltaproteobacteria bacterium]